MCSYEARHDTHSIGTDRIPHFLLRHALPERCDENHGDEAKSESSLQKTPDPRRWLRASFHDLTVRNAHVVGNDVFVVTSVETTDAIVEFGNDLI